MNHLKINQDNSKTESNVLDNVVEFLYQDLKNKETHDQDTLIGRIEIQHGYEDAVSFLNTNYRNFRCLTAGEPYIRFEDPEVERSLKLCLDNINDYTYDGIGLTQSNLDQFKRSYDLDKMSKDIVRFPEFNKLRNMTNISGGGFRNCTKLEYINLSNIITISASYAFQNAKLTEVNISSCTAITSGGTFSGCSSLVTVNAPILTTIASNGNSYFYGCTNLTTFNASNLQLSDVPNAIFAYCNNLETLNCDMTNVTYIRTNAFRECYNIPEFDLSKVTDIGGYAFSQCKNFVDIDLSSCTALDQYAFYKCSNLETVSNTSNIITVRTSCFQDCTKLESFDDFSNIVTLGNSAFRNTALTGEIDLSSCTAIPNSCFRDSKYITKVLNTNNVASLDVSAFSGCTGLTQIGNLSNVTYFPLQGYEFYGCENLEGEIDLSGTTNTLSQMTGNFYNCKKVKRIKLGIVTNYATSWNSHDNGRKAFYNCISMHTLDIQSLASFGHSHWSGLNTCSNLVNFIIRSTTIPTLDIPANEVALTTFSPNANVKIYVPDSALNDYKMADGFSNIASSIYPLSDYTPMAI